MPTVIGETAINQAEVWNDPLISLHIEEFRECVQQLEPAMPDAYDRAEHLCEASRAILFRAPRLSIPQASQLVEAFTAAIDKIRRISVTDSQRAEFIGAFADHIQRRVEALDQGIRRMSSKQFG
ncbi:MAG: hypothetical protein ACKV0T_08585 [Planctomycetales bacterium]